MALGIEIASAALDEASWLSESFARTPWTRPANYFDIQIRRQAAGELDFLVARTGGRYVGHCKVIWQPAYPHFAARGIPEVGDLVVVPEWWRRGVATALMDEAERRILARSPVAGIGVGLYADYGAAQQLYARRGYVPDGQGLYYRNRPAAAGDMVRVDDDLILYLTKRMRG